MSAKDVALKERKEIHAIKRAMNSPHVRAEKSFHKSIRRAAENPNKYK